MVQLALYERAFTSVQLCGRKLRWSDETVHCTFGTVTTQRYQGCRRGGGRRRCRLATSRSAPRHSPSSSGCRYSRPPLVDRESRSTPIIHAVAIKAWGAWIPDSSFDLGPARVAGGHCRVGRTRVRRHRRGRGLGSLGRHFLSYPIVG
jgi:hypothetical protein